jgi:hypothetical protein
MKGHKFFSLHDHSTFVSRNDVFHETIFPFASHLDHSSSISHDDIIPSSMHFPNSNTYNILDFPIHPTMPVSSPIAQSQPILSSPSFQPFIPPIIEPNTSSDSTSYVEQNPESNPSSNSNPSFVSSFVPNQLPYQSIRKSTKIKTKPSYLHDYHCKLVLSSPSQSTAMSTDSSNSYPLSSFVSYDNLSHSHNHFYLNTSQILSLSSIIKL